MRYLLEIFKNLNCLIGGNWVSCELKNISSISEKTGMKNKLGGKFCAKVPTLVKICSKFQFLKIEKSQFLDKFSIQRSWPLSRNLVEKFQIVLTNIVPIPTACLEKLLRYEMFRWWQNNKHTFSVENFGKRKKIKTFHQKRHSKETEKNAHFFRLQM